MHTGDGVDPVTTRVQPVIIPYPDDPTRRIILVDTPGWNDTWTDRTKTLQLITNWLRYS